MVMTITGPTKAKMKTQIFVTVSQYQSGSGNFSMHMVTPGDRAAMTIMGTPMAEDRTQMSTLIIFALTGVRNPSALTGWHTAM
ncbi:hypothetical protein EYF80_003521 [Liparis tanakae]|uniref:Uncharacterized protein n=1 Tax=Liparis tanakae TaxID=230148 RepID=A0A4Z2J8C8_9TELE|nr:hypothetical protein EYF80_003521 [Liparis tanakae]